MPLGISNVSIQRVLQKVRPPRVRISYDVHIGNATEKKELPFVVGVMGDFSGDPTQPLKSLGERGFIEVSRDNFDQVLARMTPGLNLRVKNTLEDNGTEIAVQLKFQSMKDFEPARIIDQVKPLKELMEARRKLTGAEDQGGFGAEPGEPPPGTAQRSGQAETSWPTKPPRQANETNNQ